MLIVALVLAVIGLAALVTAVVTSNEVIAWVCIGASALGVVLLVVDAVRERQHRRVTATVPAGTAADGDETDVDHYVDEVEVIEAAEGGDDESSPETDLAATESVAEDDDDAVEEAAAGDIAAELADEAVGEEIAEEMAVEDHPDEVVHDEPEYDTYSDDEPEYPEAAEESAVHTVTETDTEGR